jgi:GGDEF domain-containing protein
MKDYLKPLRFSQEVSILLNKLCIDPAFGIYTKQAFLHIILPQVYKKIKGVIFGDIDDLRILNKQFGYQYADEQINKALKHRGSDIIFRWYSGDELVWILLSGDVNAAIERFSISLRAVGLSITFAGKNIESLTHEEDLCPIIKELTKEVMRKKKLKNILFT